MSVCHLPEPVSSLQIVLPDEAATLAFAGRLATTLHGGLLVFLCGDLGAGKTTFSRGILRALGIAGRIKSPTYTLVESYDIAANGEREAFSMHHFDVYRFADPREWLDAGFDELLNPRSTALVEWPDKAAGCLPRPDLAASLAPLGDGRTLQLSAFSDAGMTCLTRLTNLLDSPFPTPISTC